MWSSREDSEEKSPPDEAPAPGPAERKSTNGDDARPAGLLHEPHELSTSTLTKLEAASDEVEFQQSIWDASLFLFNPVVGRSASLFAFVLLAVNVFLQGSFAFYLIDGLRPNPDAVDARIHNLNLERRQVLGHDRLEGAASRMPS